MAEPSPDRQQRGAKEMPPERQGQQIPGDQQNRKNKIQSVHKPPIFTG